MNTQFTDLFGAPVEQKKTPQQLHDEWELQQADLLSGVFRNAYLGKHDHYINIEPMPTPRIRGRIVKMKPPKTDFINFYHPTDYTKYMEKIAAIMRAMVLAGELQRENYHSVFVTFALPYPQSTPKKNLIERVYHTKRGDGDNFLKGVLDATMQAEIFKDDGCLANLTAFKRMTVKENGFFGITLVK